MQNDINSHVVVKLGYEKMVNRLLSYACDRIEQGLYLPFVNIFYAGNMSDISYLDQYQRYNVTILESVMSLAAGVNYGPQAFSVGIAPRDQSIEP